MRPRCIPYKRRTMPLDKTDIANLLHRYKKGECSKEELLQLSQLLGTESTADLEEALVESILEESTEPAFDQQKFDDLYQSLLTRTTAHTNQPKRFRIWPFVAAASVVLVCTIFFYGYQQKVFRKPMAQAAKEEMDVQPGGNRASLTLADGSVVDLSDTQAGIVMEDDIKYNNGATVLKGKTVAAGKRNHAMVGYYELKTPRGGTYQLVLSDGTKVWLNAQSSLKYPANFDANERVVELDGEAYFAVAQDAHKPFRVITKSQQIDVLGTEFNVSAYGNGQATLTTLVNGRVHVTGAVAAAGGVTQMLLKPGQQAMNLNGAAVQVREVGLAPYVSWKRGFFYFDETKLSEAMDQLSRWYNLEVVYQGKMPETYFYGEINRNKTLQKVLNILREGGVEFSVEQAGEKTRLVVLPRT